MSRRSRERREVQEKLRSIQEWRASYRQARLIDRMLVNPNEFDVFKKVELPLLEWMSNAVVIIADSVPVDEGEYGLHDDNWFPQGAGGDGPLLDKFAITEVWRKNLKGPIIPPFQYVWIEWERMWRKADDEFPAEFDQEAALIDSSYFFMKDKDDEQLPTFMVYIFPPSNSFGAFIDYDPETGLFKEVTGVGESHPFADDPRWVDLAYRAVKTLSILNCKNVELIDRDYSPDQQRKFQKHWGQPLRKFKTLSVKPVGKSAQVSEPKDYQGLMPLHIRRGNFATYTDESPLFGKYTGTFWRPATVVGEEKRGVVTKDYKVVTE